MSRPKKKQEMGNRAETTKDVMEAVMANSKSAEKSEARGRKKIVDAARKASYTIFTQNTLDLLEYLLPRYQILLQDQGSTKRIDRSLMVELMFRERAEQLFDLPEKFKLDKLED